MNFFDKLKKILCCAILLSNITLTNAQNVNYSEHVAPIIYKHCTSCHRQGEVAPFPLTNYNEVKTWSQMIAYATSIRYMPPWKADPNKNHFQGENYLTDAQIKTIGNWVKQGTPQGNPSLEPKLPTFPKGSQVGTPDLVVSFKKAYKHVGNNKDEYRYFVLPTGLKTPKDLVALEVRPGNNKMVHHTLAWADTTGASATEDAKTPEYGYESPQTTSLSNLNNQLPGYVPGQRPVIYNNGIAQRLGKNTDILLQMHYAPTTADEFDSTSVNLFFAKKPAKRYVKSNVMIPFFNTLKNGPFTIPANQVKEFWGTYTFTEKVSLLDISPHMHKLGKHWKVYAITPTKDTVSLINVNEWDFNWQGTYSYKKPVVLPKGTVVHAFAKYDNTTANISNPNNPPKFVSWGENTSDEMYYLPFSWVTYQAGDENLDLETYLTSNEDTEFYSIKNQLYPIAPNPTTDNVRIGFSLQEEGYASLAIFDLQGKKVKNIFENQAFLPGLHQEEASVGVLPRGFYVATLTFNGKVYSQKIIKE